MAIVNIISINSLSTDRWHSSSADLSGYMRHTLLNASRSHLILSINSILSICVITCHWNDMCKLIKMYLNAENVIILSLNTVMHYFVAV